MGGLLPLGWCQFLPQAERFMYLRVLFTSVARLQQNIDRLMDAVVCDLLQFVTVNNLTIKKLSIV